jgi:hypothetical protein
MAEPGKYPLDEEKRSLGDSSHQMKEVEIKEDLSANIQVAGNIPFAAWLILISKQIHPIYPVSSNMRVFFECPPHPNGS